MPQNPAAAGVLLLVLVGVIGIGGIWAADTTVDAVGNETTINDTVNQTTTFQPVGERGLDRYGEPSNVSNSSGELAESDYEWNATDGTIAFAERQNQTNSTAPENVTVAGVTAVGLPDQSGPFLDLAGVLLQVPGWMGLIAAVGAVVFALRALNRRRTRRGGVP